MHYSPVLVPAQVLLYNAQQFLSLFYSFATNYLVFRFVVRKVNYIFRRWINFHRNIMYWTNIKIEKQFLYLSTNFMLKFW